jgi:hypothetical protein
MDIDLYGFTFSNFIKGFKKNFKIDNNTYDYMSFLKQVDPGSYVVLVLTYNNPNEVLNSQLTSTLNNINVVSGENGQTGGVNYNVFAMIFLMFILCANTVFSGEKMQQAIKELGVVDVTQLKSLAMEEKSKQPIESTYATPGYIYGMYSLTPQQKAEYDRDYASWKDRQDLAFSAIAEASAEESGALLARQQQAQSSSDWSRTQLVKAEAEKYKIQGETDQSAQLMFQYTKAMEDLLAEKAKTSKYEGIAQGILGTLAVIGGIGFGIFAILSRRNRRYLDGNSGSTQYREIGNGQNVMPEGRRLMGGKTRRRNRNHKKRHTKRRR